MSRYRLYPEAAQEEKLLMHCGHARFVWNLAVEQLGYASRGRWCPNFAQQCRQLTEVRHEYAWLAEGSTIVQQQALKDFDQAMKHWRNAVLRRPTWRKAGRREGFRIVGQDSVRVEQLNRRWSRVSIPKVGLGQVPAHIRSSRVQVLPGNS